jgi:hypothetical protein
MGGFGSGRQSGPGRGKVEGCRSLDVNRFHWRENGVGFSGAKQAGEKS